ncbi:hypothetical protein HDZ31DRAFT_70091, partial [Schizophyllum fasciatum]
FPSKLRELLEDRDIVKAGLVQTSAVQLYDEYSIALSNVVDISLLARSVDGKRWKKGNYQDLLSLRELIAAYYEHSFPKNSDGFPKHLDWSLTLREELMLYAANSAHGRWQVYTKLAELLDAMETPPLRVCYAYDVRLGGLCEQGTAVRWEPRNPDYKPVGKAKGAQAKGQPAKGKARAQAKPMVPRDAPPTVAAQSLASSAGPSSARPDIISVIRGGTASRQARARAARASRSESVNTAQSLAEAPQVPLNPYILHKQKDQSSASPQANPIPSTSGPSAKSLPTPRKKRTQK